MAVHGEQLVFKMWVTLALPPPTSWAGPIPEALGPPNHLLPPPLSIGPDPPGPVCRVADCFSNLAKDIFRGECSRPINSTYT